MEIKNMGMAGEYAFNRTNVELKQMTFSTEPELFLAFNRTNVELKYFFDAAALSMKPF